MNIKHYIRTDDVFELAASLPEKLIKNHTFPDSNNRTVPVATDMFLKINRYRLQEKPIVQDSVKIDLADAHNAVFTSQWTPEQLAGYYKTIAIPVSEWSEEMFQYRNDSAEY